jgi:UDP-glucuronate 4-epimerase
MRRQVPETPPSSGLPFSAFAAAAALRAFRGSVVSDGPSDGEDDEAATGHACLGVGAPPGATSEGRHILITGGAGFIGCALAQSLRRDARVSLVVLLDLLAEAPYDPALKLQRLADSFNLSAFEPHPLGTSARAIPVHGQADIVFVCGDAADFALVARLLRTHRVDTVVQLAAQPSVRLQRSAEECWRSNVGPLQGVCEAIHAELGAAEGARVGQLLHFSSSSVYGSCGLVEGGWPETALQAPQGSYAAAKAGGEALLAAWASSHQDAVRVTVTRPFSVFGPAGRPDMAPLAFLDGAFRGQSIPFSVHEDSTPILRDFTFVGDVVSACISILFDGLRAPPPPEALAVYNLGLGAPVALSALLDSVQRVLARRALHAVTCIRHASDLPTTHANNARARAALAWEPVTGLDAGVASMAAWYCDLFDRKEPAFVVALVATCGRPVLLRRALRSIAAQARPVDALVIVVDAEGGAFDHISADATSAVAELDWARCSVGPRVLRNTRTRGASGAWNTGIIEAAALAPQGRSWGRVFVAVLDDDDEWTVSHVAACTDAARSSGAHMVVSGILRKTSAEDEGRRQAVMAPEQLLRSTFYTGNPHLQGSNMFASVSLFARAGLFGEALLSTTDRDLMARVAALPPHEVGLVALAETWSAICHADPTQADRLSTPGSSRKRAGLAAFLSIHGPAMLSEQRHDFLQRAKNVFCVDDLVGAGEACGAKPSAAPLHLAPAAASPERAPFPLVVGIAADSADGDTIRPLLRDLARLQAEAGAPHVLVWAIVFENGACAAESSLTPLAEAVAAEAAHGGLLTALVTAAQVIEDLEAGIFPPLEEAALRALRGGERLPISAARTIVQRYALSLALGLRARARVGNGAGGGGLSRNPIVWILDDDKSLDPLRAAQQAAGRHAAALEPRWEGKRILQRAIEVHEETGAGIVLGVDSEAPPLPALSCLRLQLVDVLAVLHAVSAAVAQGGSLESPLAPCSAVRRGPCLTPTACGADGYYDLSTARSDHLEVPVCPMCLVASGCWGFCAELAAPPTAGDALRLLSDFVIPKIAAGAMVTRPLVAPEVAAPVPSVLRGGCTFVFNLDALRVPNLAPFIGGRATRRSDMLFCIINRSLGVGCVRAPDLAVRHRRVCRDAAPNYSDALRTLADDVCGHAVYTAFDSMLRDHGSTLLTPSAAGTLPQLEPGKESAILGAMAQHLDSRALLARFSFGRMHGLLSAASHTTEELSAAAGAVALCERVRSHLLRVRAAFGVDILWPPPSSPWGLAPKQPLDAALDPLRRATREGSEVARGLLRALSCAVAWKGPTEEASAAVSDRLRARAAAAILTGRLIDGAPLGSARVVAVGGEGVTFRVPAAHLAFKVRGSLPGDDVAVKVMDLYNVRAPPGHWAELLSLTAAWPALSGSALPPVTGLLAASLGPAAGVGLVARPWLDAAPYSGGMGAQLLNALREIASAGVALGNVSPDNLLVVDGGGSAARLCLVDVGLDILHATPRRLRVAALRGFLCWRWAGVLAPLQLRALLAAARFALARDAEGSQPLEAVLPEAAGFAGFEAALAEGGGASETAAWLARAAATACGFESTAAPRSFLDYGSGTPLLLSLLAASTPASGRFLVGYDPSPGASLRWAAYSGDFCLLEDRASVLSRAQTVGGFDVAICTPSLLGAHGSETEATVFADLSASISPTGVALVVVLAAPYSPPLRVVRRLLRAAGLEPLYDQPCLAPLGADTHCFEPTPSAFLLSCVRANPALPPLLLQPRPVPARPRAALLIKACAMEWRMLPQLVRHIVSACEGPHEFDGGIHLVLDSTRNSAIPRPYAEPCSSTALVRIGAALIAERVIDRVIDAEPASADPAAVQSLNARWFGAPSTATHDVNGCAIFSTLLAFESIAKSGVDFVLQVDSDLMLRRGCDERGARAPFLSRALALFLRDDAVLTLSLPVTPPLPPAPASAPFSYLDCAGKPWRTEVRGCYLHLPRLLRALPLAGDGTGTPSGGLRPWYRALDEVIAASNERLRSVRGGDAAAISFVHPPNVQKKEPRDYGLLIDYVERGGPLPHALAGVVDAPPACFKACVRTATAAVAAGGGVRTWARPEDYVVVATGRRAPPSRVLRCLASISAQTVPTDATAGLVVVWDCPEPHARDVPRCEREDGWEGVGELLKALLRPGGLPIASRATLLMPRAHCGALAALLAGVSTITNPAAVVIHVDLHDCLVGTDALAMVHAAFAEQGADVVMGGALRLNAAAAMSRGAGVPPWCMQGSSEHLPLLAARAASIRSLRAEDFEQPGRTMARISGAWPHQLPLINMAARAAVPQRAVYLSEPPAPCCCAACEPQPAVPAEDRPAPQPPYACRHFRVAVLGNASYDSSPASLAAAAAAEAAGYALTAAGYLVVSGGLGGAMEACSRGAARAVASLSGAAPPPVACGALAVWARAAPALGALGVLPGADQPPNPFVAAAVHTGIGHARNSIVAATADAAIIVGGGAGTMAEAAAAWTSGRLLVAISGTGGTADLLAGRRLDERRRLHGMGARAIPLEQDIVHSARDAAHAVSLINTRLHWHRAESLRRAAAAPGVAAVGTW